MQTSLFGESNHPEGFLYFPDFISPEEEKKWIAEIQETELHTFIFQGYTAKRKVASFGYDYSFSDGKLSKGKPIPESFQPLIEKVAVHLSLSAASFAELLLIEYPPGAVINWHRDAPPFDLIAGISLAADCTFRLRPYEKAKQNRKAILSLNVQRRSLYVLHGAARTEWQHSTQPLTQTRYSITLRTLRNP